MYLSTTKKTNITLMQQDNRTITKCDQPSISAWPPYSKHNYYVSWIIPILLKKGIVTNKVEQI